MPTRRRARTRRSAGAFEVRQQIRTCRSSARRAGPSAARHCLRRRPILGKAGHAESVGGARDRALPAGLHRVCPRRKYRTVKTSTFGYARPEDGAYIAYRVDGDGPIDIVWHTNSLETT